MSQERYLPVDVYKVDGRDCTNNGVTVQPGVRLVVPCKTGHISAADVAEHGYTVLEPGKAGNRLHFKPAGAKGWTMFGGNFVYTSDSRFSETYGQCPVHVHDRIE